MKSKPRGFAAMKAAGKHHAMSRIASMGGKAVAAKYGTKHMQKIGRLGGSS